MSQRSHLPTAALDPKQLVSLLRESEDLKLEVVSEDDEPELEVRALGTDMSPPIADDADDLDIPIELTRKRETSWFASFVLTLLVLAALGAAIWLL